MKSCSNRFIPIEEQMISRFKLTQMKLHANGGNLYTLYYDTIPFYQQGDVVVSSVIFYSYFIFIIYVFYDVQYY